MKSPCLEPGCPNFADYRGRCPEHHRARERERNRQRKGTYNSKRWQVLRRRQLFIEPLGARCKR
jgi:hypothetical protein